MAQKAGRDPASLELIVRANVEFADPMPGQDRVHFTGTLEQIAGDVAATRTLGVAELVFDVQFSPGVETVDDIIVRMEQLWELSKAFLGAGARGALTLCACLRPLITPKAQAVSGCLF